MGFWSTFIKSLIIGLKGFVVSLIAGILGFVLQVFVMAVAKVSPVLAGFFGIITLIVMFAIWGYLANRIWKWD